MVDVQNLKNEFYNLVSLLEQQKPSAREDELETYIQIVVQEIKRERDGYKNYYDNIKDDNYLSIEKVRAEAFIQAFQICLDTIKEQLKYNELKIDDLNFENDSDEK